MQHRHIADHHRLVGPVGRYAGLAIELVEDSIHGRHDRGLELFETLRAIHRMADTRDDIASEWRLPVEGGADRGGHAGPRVHVRPAPRRRAAVERTPESLLSPVA